MSLHLEAEETNDGLIHLTVLVDDVEVWPHPDQADTGSDFDPEDILAWLSDAWPSLNLTRSWPIPFTADQEPRSLTGLMRAAEERWDDVYDVDTVARESALVDGFLYAHDLSQMKHGAGLPEFLVLRQHDRVRIETNRRIYETVSFKAFIVQLAGLGSKAMTLLRKRGDATAARLIERWKGREKIDPVDAAALISGLSRTEISGPFGLPVALVESLRNRPLSNIANDNASPIQAAARGSGMLGVAGMAEVIGCIQGLPDGEPSALAKFSRYVSQQIRDASSALDQGIRAADRTRERFALATDAVVDLGFISDQLGLLVKRVEIADERLDGIATIGPRHGPAIVLNTATRRHGAGADDLERCLRFTWAHELGHLLLDRQEWPAVVDAVRQRVPRAEETRANAFATYLLLPPPVARRAWQSAGSPTDWPRLELLLNQLTATFGLPRINASRQLVRAIPDESREWVRQAFMMHIQNFEGR
jgi:Zn-dependent peptidase ImmA (M78 family)